MPILGIVSSADISQIPLIIWLLFFLFLNIDFFVKFCLMTGRSIGLSEDLYLNVV